MIKKTLFSILSSVLIMPSMALAQSGGISIQSMVAGAVRTAFYIADGVVVILWIFAGILFLGAQGDPGKLTSARQAVMTAIIGTVLVIVANSAVYIVGSMFNLSVF